MKPTETIEWLYNEAMRDAVRNQVIMEMQAGEISALKEYLATPLPCRCWWCRLVVWIAEVRYGKPV